MAFGDRDHHEMLLLRTIRGTFDVRGRSRRTEVACWWLVSSVLSALVGQAVTWLGSEEAGRQAAFACSMLSLIPGFALFVRRLHDQDRSGWWALFVPALIAVMLPQMIASLSPDVDIRLAARPHGLFLLAGLSLMLALFAFSLAPGTVGPNRFGPDPREDGAKEAGEEGCAA